MGSGRFALPVVLAACGHVSSTGADGGGGGPDASTRGAVSITIGHVFGDSQAIEDLTVLVVGPDGGLLETTTDAAGAASVEGVAAGSTLLVFLRSLPAGAPEGRLTIAVAGIEPGDAIVFADPSPPRTPLGSMTIQFPARTDAAGYRVQNGCDIEFPTTTSTPIDFDDGCVTGGTFNLFIRAADSGGGLLGWIGGSGTFVSGEPFVLDATWTDPEDLAVDLVNVPAEPKTATPRMTPIIGDFEYSATNRSPATLTGDDIQLRVPAPTAYVESRAVTVDLEPNNTGFGLQTMTHRLPAAQDSIEISLADELLPWYGVGTFVAGDRTLAWTRSAGRQPDAQVVATTWIEQGEAAENGIFLVAPPDATEVVLPSLPADYLEYAPVDPSTINVGVFGADASLFDGYGAARQRGFEILDSRSLLAAPAPSSTHLSAGPNAEL